MIHMYLIQTVRSKMLSDHKLGLKLGKVQQQKGVAHRLLHTMEQHQRPIRMMKQQEPLLLMELALI